MVAEAAGIDAPLLALADLDHVECNRDFCRWAQGKGASRRVILASHGRDRIEGADMAAACAAHHVLCTAPWLPRECAGRWLTTDRNCPPEHRGPVADLGDPPR